MYQTSAGCYVPGRDAGLCLAPSWRFSGLGAAEAGCDDPVEARVRDELVNEAKRLTGDYAAQTPAKGRGFHWHEGHPDLRAWWEDWYPRINGLEKRPKLVRCNARAREKIKTWIEQAKHTLAVTKKTVPGRGSVTVVPAGGLKLPLLNSRTYHIRGPWFDGKFQAIPKVATGSAATTTTTRRTPAAAGSGRAPVLPPELEGVWASLTTGEFYGVPRAYITYGVAALLAYNLFLKGRR